MVEKRYDVLEEEQGDAGHRNRQLAPFPSIQTYQTLPIQGMQTEIKSDSTRTRHP
jgi:hypothetical protein